MPPTTRPHLRETIKNCPYTGCSRNETKLSSCQDAKFIRRSELMVDMKESEILEKLKLIKEDVKYIKEHMVDIDMMLTPDEERVLEESIGEFEKGETVKVKDLKREDSEL